MWTLFHDSSPNEKWAGWGGEMNDLLDPIPHTKLFCNLSLPTLQIRAIHLGIPVQSNVLYYSGILVITVMQVTMHQIAGNSHRLLPA